MAFLYYISFQGGQRKDLWVRVILIWIPPWLLAGQGTKKTPSFFEFSAFQRQVEMMVLKPRAPSSKHSGKLKQEDQEFSLGYTVSPISKTKTRKLSTNLVWLSWKQLTVWGLHTCHPKELRLELTLLSVWGHRVAPHRSLPGSESLGGPPFSFCGSHSDASLPSLFFLPRAKDKWKGGDAGSGVGHTEPQ